MELIKSDMISFETGSVIISYIDIGDFSESEFQRALKDVPGIVRDQAELEEVWRRRLLGRWLIMKTMEMYYSIRFGVLKKQRNLDLLQKEFLELRLILHQLKDYGLQWDFFILHKEIA